jgi:hypothetical protein
MIARLRQLLDTVRSLHAVPHLITTMADLELRLERAESDAARLCAIAEELYLAPPADAEVPDA